MVGATLALALGRLDARIALIERTAPDAAEQSSFDERTTALSNASRRIFEALGVWRSVQALATPILKIHVSERGRFGFARIDAREQGLDALGYVLSNRELGRVVWNLLEHTPGVRVFCPAEVRGLRAADEAGGEHVHVELQGESAEVRAKLVVAADGAQSKVAQAAGIKSVASDYHETALVSVVLPQRFHAHVAYERFTDEGPLALLPLSDGRCALVLTLDQHTVPQALGWSDAEFLREVQARFGFRLGRFLHTGRRAAYPLALRCAESTSASRCIVMGNAAQTLHPVAGMGFNLGLRDAACLAELIARDLNAAESDFGREALLREYDAWRAQDRRGVIAFTDTLVRTFNNPLSTVGWARRAGLLAFDLLPPAKAALARLASGSARGPRLARGVPWS